MFPSILLVLGVAVLGMAFRSYRHPFFQRLSILCILSVSFLIGYLPFHSWISGCLVASSWLLLPWIDILTRVRRLRLPVQNVFLKKTPPSHRLFPHLSELTAEMEAEGFEQVDDVGCDLESQQQFLRLFHRPSDQIQSAICLVSQQELAFYYISLVTRLRNGTIFMSWNYPFSYSLKFSPQTKVQRVRPNQSVAELCLAHRAFVDKHAPQADILPLEPGHLQQLLQDDLQAQIKHNIRSGLLKRDGSQGVRYTWRGMFFLWFRFLLDFVRL
jgi:hypothetical protein